MGLLLSRCCSCFTINDKDDDVAVAPWSDIPALPLHTIATHHLPNLQDFLTLSRVCTAWRSVLNNALPDFITSKPPMLLLSTPSPNTDYTCRFYSITDNKSFGARLPEARCLDCAGFSQGNLIMQDRVTRRTPTILDPFSGATIHLPAAPHKFTFGVLSAAPTAPGCRIFLFTNYSIQHRLVRADVIVRWVAWLYTEGIFGRGRDDIIIGAAASVNDWLVALTRKGKAVRIRFKGPFQRSTPAEISLISIFDEEAEVREADKAFPAVGEMDGHAVVALDTKSVFQYDRRGKKWEKVRGLGHRALLVSNHECRVWDVRGVEGVEGNCIYWAGWSEKIVGSLYGWGKETLS